MSRIDLPHTIASELVPRDGVGSQIATSLWDQFHGAVACKSGDAEFVLSGVAIESNGFVCLSCSGVRAEQVMLIAPIFSAGVFQRECTSWDMDGKRQSAFHEVRPNRSVKQVFQFDEVVGPDSRFDREVGDIHAPGGAVPSINAVRRLSARGAGVWFRHLFAWIDLDRCPERPTNKDNCHRDNRYRKTADVKLPDNLGCVRFGQSRMALAALRNATERIIRYAIERAALLATDITVDHDSIPPEWSILQQGDHNGRLR